MEQKIREVLERQENEKKELKREYDRRFNRLFDGNPAEVDADKVLELNAWYEQQKKAMSERWTQAWISIGV